MAHAFVNLCINKQVLNRQNGNTKTPRRTKKARFVSKQAFLAKLYFLATAQLFTFINGCAHLPLTISPATQLLATFYTIIYQMAKVCQLFAAPMKSKSGRKPHCLILFFIKIFSATPCGKRRMRYKSRCLTWRRLCLRYQKQHPLSPRWFLRVLFLITVFYLCSATYFLSASTLSVFSHARSRSSLPTCP